MAKIIKFVAGSIAIFIIFVLGIIFLSPAAIKYGIYLGMSSDDAQQKLLAQGFKDVDDKSDFTDGGATQYFQKGRVLISIQWEHDISPMNPPGMVSNINIDENTN
jgi:hypothetical protein